MRGVLPAMSESVYHRRRQMRGLRRLDPEALLRNELLSMKARKIGKPRPSANRRHWCLASDTVYLNHGSFGACPQTVFKLQTELRQKMEATPVQFLWRNYE